MIVSEGTMLTDVGKTLESQTKRFFSVGEKPLPSAWESPSLIWR